MNIVKLLLVLVCFVGVISGAAFNFQFDGTYCGAEENPCRFVDSQNWKGGSAPVNGSDCYIDFTGVPNVGKTVYIILSVNMTLSSIQIVGTTNTNVRVSFLNTNLLITKTLSGNNNTAIIFDNQAKNNVTSKIDADVEVNGRFSLTNGSLVEFSYSVIHFVNDVFVDQTSNFTAHYYSNVQIDGISQFYTNPSFTDDSNLIANECFFNAGINSDSRVTLGETTFFGASNLNIFTMNGDIFIENGATLAISNLFKFTKNPTITVSKSSLIISGSAPETFPSIILKNGNLICFHPIASFANGIQGSGVVTFDIPNGGTASPQNTLSKVNSTDINVVVAGASTLFIKDCTFGSLTDKRTSLTNITDHQPTPSVQFDGSNSMIFISTNFTQIVFSDASMNILVGPDFSVVQKYPINLLGDIDMNQGAFLGDIDTMDKDSYLGLNDVMISGSVDLIAGRLHPQGDSSILKDFIMSANALLDMDETSNQFSIMGNFEMDSSSTIFISETLSTDSQSLISVGGNLVLNGTLIFDISETNPSDGDSYNLIDCSGVVVGTFSTITPIANGQTTTLNYKVSVSNNIVSIEFGSKAPSHKKLPGWAVFLIILAVLVTVAGAAYGYIRYKKRAGYLPINH
ncbi:hypothetical protein RB653_002064 [Dictyostelium firmibasis]|uniref:Uncharacterized protein n=1 Tax=Dictyostelium firmibasis TaxID=79012 RepID=A0AAN7YPQ3_9MYCE